MIVRMWRGETALAKADRYFELMNGVALRDYRATPGNLGAYALRRDRGDRVEFVMLTFWVSIEAVRGFAGPDETAARYYDFDDDFLLRKRPSVEHYSTTAGSVR